MTSMATSALQSDPMSANRANDADAAAIEGLEKMGYAHEIATVLREISSEKHGTRLEWIIILLIAVEVVFELRRVFLERHAPEGEEHVSVKK